MHTHKLAKRRNIPFWLLKAIKIGVGSSVAVLIGEVCGLQYATLAGIVTLLTIRNTKRDTFAIGGKRLFSFLVSMFAIALIWNAISNSSLRFITFMLLLATVSCATKWEDTISVNAVIGGHVLLLENAMTLAFFGNEFALMVIGVGTAIAFNWYMPGMRDEILSDIAYVELEMKNILLQVASELHQAQPIAEKPTRILALKDHIEQASEKALDNMNNTLTARGHAHSKYYVEYLNMRKTQCLLLFQCHQALLGIAHDGAEIHQMADIMEEIAGAVHHKIGIRLIIAELEEIVCAMKTETLPQTNMEFISAAQIFHALELLEELLWVKRGFLQTLTDNEKELYWKE